MVNWTYWVFREPGWVRKVPDLREAIAIQIVQLSRLSILNDIFQNASKFDQIRPHKFRTRVNGAGSPEDSTNPAINFLAMKRQIREIRTPIGRVRFQAYTLSLNVRDPGVSCG